MSTGANCRIKEKKPGQWYYELQQYPYGQTEDYDTEGPFKTFREADMHLDANHANPGGYSIHALPGCKHDLLRAYQFSGPHEKHMRNCDRCGGYVDVSTDAEKAEQARKLRDAKLADLLVRFGAFSTDEMARFLKAAVLLLADRNMQAKAVHSPGCRSRRC